MSVSGRQVALDLFWAAGLVSASSWRLALSESVPGSLAYLNFVGPYSLYVLPRVIVPPALPITECCIGRITQQVVFQIDILLLCIYDSFTSEGFISFQPSVISECMHVTLNSQCLHVTLFLSTID